MKMSFEHNVCVFHFDFDEFDRSKHIFMDKNYPMTLKTQHPISLSKHFCTVMDNIFGDNWTYYILLSEHFYNTASEEYYWTRDGFSFIFNDTKNAMKFKLTFGNDIFNV